jgi:antitoxin (DNA-binding transcriptional repressor) of toxin-antitoxin stability system
VNVFRFPWLATIDSYCKNESQRYRGQEKLPELVKAVEDGEQVTIYRRGTPVVDMVRTTTGSKEKPRSGTLKDKIIIPDPNWWKPMTDQELDAFLDRL